MSHRPRVGLLPLYLKLYDDTEPGARPGFEAFLDTVEQRLRDEGADVERAPVCRVSQEFRHAVADIERRGVDLLATLHLAYSPSLEAIDALAATHLPLLLLDTTMDYAFGPGVDPSRIMYNHGIHGVQDLACMLRRRERPYDIVAGHVTESDVVPRAVAIARASVAAKRLRGAAVLRLGPAFAGMGDFSVCEETLRERFGIRVDGIDVSALAGDVAAVAETAVAAELARDRETCEVTASDEVHARSVRVSLGLRRALERGSYGAFSMNFAAFDDASGPVDTVPFLEASKAMARGIGYAGEGDVLTATLVGALAGAFGRTTFTEIFCPDWEGNTLFLSHMGEINPEVVAGKPRVCERPFPWAGALDPAVIVGAPAPGPAVYVNLAPGPGDSFDLLLSPVEVLEDTCKAEMQDCVRGWIRPRCDLQAFLETYSRHGGTHHSALVLGDRTEALQAFAGFLGMDAHVIG